MVGKQIFRQLGMLFVVASLFAGASVIAGQPYSFQMQLTVDGRVVSTPAAVVAIGTPGEVEVSTKDGHAYRVQIDPKHAVTTTGITPVTVSLRLLERESSRGAWKLIASPKMTGNPTNDKPLKLHWSHTPADGVPLELDVRVVPGDRLASSGLN
mgnify:CR=1 FL=1